MINCELLPDNKANFEIVTRLEADQDDLQIVYDNLKKLAVPSIRKGNVRFQAVFAVHGGSGQILPSTH